MANKIATREAYGDALKEFGAKFDIVVLDADLTKSTKTDTFKKEFPERHINCGIAEGNMMDVAAGIATTGKTVFASTFAMFAAGRAFEQIRNGIGYTHLNVKIGATHAGLSVGEDGATHQCNEDIGLMTTIPGMVVLSPCDAAETRAAVQAAIEHDGPVYLRLGRLAVDCIHEDGMKLEIGKGFTLQDGSDVTIIATGLMVQLSLKAAEVLKEKGISARVIDMVSLKPIDEELIVKAAKETGAIVTAEEHNIFGGLGSLVSSVTAQKCPVPVRMVGVEDSFGKSGTVPAVLEKYGLTVENIVAKALDVISAKK